MPLRASEVKASDHHFDRQLRARSSREGSTFGHEPRFSSISILNNSLAVRILRGERSPLRRGRLDSFPEHADQPLYPVDVEQTKYHRPADVYRYFPPASRAEGRRQLEELRRYTHRVKGLPGHISHAMFLRQDETGKPLYSLEQMKGYIRSPRLTIHTKNLLHMPHNSFNVLLGLADSPTDAKRQMGGLSYLSWFLHDRSIKGAPNQYTPATFQGTKANVEDNEYYDRHALRRPGAKLPKDQIKRIGNEAPIYQLESHAPSFGRRARAFSGGTERALHKKERFKKYIVTILDLRGSDLPFLKRLRSESQELLKSRFDVSDRDLLKQYFHFPTDPLTATLHLHSRVNQYIMPIERTKAFSLDDIIDHLERGNDDVYDLILEKARSDIGLLWTSPLDFFEDLKRDGNRFAPDVRRIGGFTNGQWSIDPAYEAVAGGREPALPKDLFKSALPVAYWEDG